MVAAAVAGPVGLAVAAAERGGVGNLPSLQFSAGMEMREDRAADFFLFCFEQKWREWKEIEALEMLGESRNGGWAGRRERSSYERKASGGSADFGAFSSNPT